MHFLNYHIIIYYNNITLNYDTTLNLSGTNQLKVANPNLWNINGTSLYYNSGNIGFNNTNPAYKLDVSGGINVNNAVVRATTTSGGYSQLNGGGSTTNVCGYISFHNNAGTRRGYMGWIGTDANYLMIQAENGCSGYELNGNLKINNFFINTFK